MRVVTRCDILHTSASISSNQTNILLTLTKCDQIVRWDPVKPKGARLREDDSYFDSDALLDGYNQVNIIAQHARQLARLGLRQRRSLPTNVGSRFVSQPGHSDHPPPPHHAILALPPRGFY